MSGVKEWCGQPVRSGVRNARDRLTAAPRAWRFTGGEVLLDRPRIMAIVNVTPDSFYDGGRLSSVEEAVAAAALAVESGADVLDVGGESTRPGSAAVSAEEQIRRVAPVIEGIRRAGIACPVSVDTTRAEVARAALDAGAGIINDVSAGTDDPAVLRVAAERGAGLVLMHRLVRPEKDRYSDRYESPPGYGDVVAEVREYLAGRARAAIAAGVDPAAIVIDPGLGFGKTVEQNLELIRRTNELAGLGFPVLSALSRKSFVGRVSLGRDSTPDERLGGTVGLSVVHLLAGASVFRVHDVREAGEALRAAAGVWGPAADT